MPVIIDNDGIRFAEEFRKLCEKYVKESSLLQMTFNDGTTVGMRTLLEIGLGIKKLETVSNMETTNTYLTTEQAIEDSKKKDGLIPSEFLSIFPNNFGINLCAVKGFNIEMTEDKQYKSITVDFLPVPKKLSEPHFFIVESENFDEDSNIIKSEFDLSDEDVTEFLNNGAPEKDWVHYEIYCKIPVSKMRLFA